MKNRLLSGIVFLIIGFLIAIGPKTIFAVCEPMEDGHYMKCHWAAQAELGVGLVIVLLAVLVLVIVSRQIRIGLNIGITVLALLAVLIPTELIGVCGGEHMQCHSLTRPVLVLLGVVGILYSLVNVVYLWKNKEKELDSNEK